MSTREPAARGVAAPLRADLLSRRQRPRVAHAVARRHRGRDHVLRRLLAATDAVALGVGIAVAALLGIAHGAMRGGTLAICLAFIPVVVVVFKAMGLYERDVRQISHGTVDELPTLVQAALTSATLLWALLHVAGQDHSYSLPLVSMAVASSVVLAFRAAVRRVVPRALGAERLLVIGDGPGVARVVRGLQGTRGRSVEVVGLVGASELPLDVPDLGPIAGADLDTLLELHRVERVIVAPLDPSAPDHAGRALALRLDVMRLCKCLQIPVAVVPELADAMGSSVLVDHIQGVTVLSVQPPVLSRSSRWMKRGIDLVGAGTLLVLLSPVLAGVAVAVRLSSPGPVFFRQRRVGLYGRRFTILKFRTMVDGAEALQEALRGRSRDPDWLLLEDDPRITPVGRLLRATSIDELPQLWNVLRGEMSLVGPRPIIESEDSLLEGWRRNRVDLKPGLTGLWQILGRTEIPFEEMVKLDYLYVTNWSLWSDIRVILRTIPAVTGSRGAN